MAGAATPCGLCRNKKKKRKQSAAVDPLALEESSRHSRDTGDPQVLPRNWQTVDSYPAFQRSCQVRFEQSRHGRFYCADTFVIHGIVAGYVRKIHPSCFLSTDTPANNFITRFLTAHPEVALEEQPCNPTQPKPWLGPQARLQEAAGRVV